MKVQDIPEGAGLDSEVVESHPLQLVSAIPAWHSQMSDKLFVPFAFGIDSDRKDTNKGVDTSLALYSPAFTCIRTGSGKTRKGRSLVSLALLTAALSLFLFALPLSALLLLETPQLQIGQYGKSYEGRAEVYFSEAKHAPAACSVSCFLFLSPYPCPFHLLPPCSPLRTRLLLP